MQVSRSQLIVDWTMVVGAMQASLTCLTECRSSQAPKTGDLLVGAQCPTILHFLLLRVDEWMSLWPCDLQVGPHVQRTLGGAPAKCTRAANPHRSHAVLARLLKFPKFRRIVRTLEC
jgi:hypothetical protein